MLYGMLIDYVTTRRTNEETTTAFIRQDSTVRVQKKRYGETIRDMRSRG